MEVVDRNIQVYLEFERRLRPKIRALLTDELIAEHEADAARAPLRRPPARHELLPPPAAARQVHPRRDEAVAGVPHRRRSPGSAARCVKILGDETFDERGGRPPRHLPAPRGRPEGGGLMAEPMLRPATIHGYADRLSVAPGETIEFKVSCDEPGSYRADLVRLDPRRHEPRRPGLQGGGDRKRGQRLLRRPAPADPRPART